MSEEDKKVPEVILVGGSKDGTIAEGGADTRAINNIVLNEAKDGPEFIDLYMPTNVTDKEDRPIYAHVGRYDATESASYWATLSQEEKDALKEAAEKAEAEAAAAKEEEDAKAAEEAAKEKPEEAKEDEKVVEETVVEEAKSDEAVVEDKETGEEAGDESSEAESDDTESDQGSDGSAADEVVEVEPEKAD